MRLICRIRPRYDVLDQPTDHVNTLSTQKSRKAMKKDGSSYHLGSKTGRSFMADMNKNKENKQTLNSQNMKSNVSLEITNKDTEIVKPLPPPLVRPRKLIRHSPPGTFNFNIYFRGGGDGLNRFAILVFQTFASQMRDPVLLRSVLLLCK